MKSFWVSIKNNLDIVLAFVIGWISFLFGLLVINLYLIQPLDPNKLLGLAVLGAIVMALGYGYGKYKPRIKTPSPTDEVLFRNFLTHRESDYRALVNVLKKYRIDDKGIKAIIEQKKNELVNIANISFHYRDESKITTIYNDYFKEPTIEQLVNEITSELGGDIKGGLPEVIEARAGGRDVSKWISTIKVPDVSVAEMFRRYQRETIKNDQVILGLELVDVDLSDLNDFEETMSEIQEKYDFHLDEDQIELQRVRLKKKAAEKTLLRLEKAADWVLIDGKFSIGELPDGYYKCIYTHPVNEYLGKDSPKVTISTIFHKDDLEPAVAGNYAQSIGKLIPMKVYGKIWMPVDRSQDNWELQITPLAIY